MSQGFRALNCHALDVANLIIKKYIDNDVYISNLILQKVLYFVQRNSLQNKQTSLFTEQFEAWKFGPVVPEVYYNFCCYGAFPLALDDGAQLIKCPEISDIVDCEFVRCRDKTPFELVQETHKHGGAWEKIVQNGSGLRHAIPNRLICELG